MNKREWHALNMSSNEIYDYAMAAEALAAEMKGELDKLTQELYDSKYLAAARLKMNNELGAAATKVLRTSLDQNKLLRRAHRMLERCGGELPSIFERHDTELMNDLEEKLGDE